MYAGSVLPIYMVSMIRQVKRIEELKITSMQRSLPNRKKILGWNEIDHATNYILIKLYRHNQSSYTRPNLY